MKILSFTIMDIQSEKLNLIKWLAGISDVKVIKKLKTLQRSIQKNNASTPLTKEQKNAIDKGLKSIKKGSVKTHDSAMTDTKKKYPDLFK